MFALYKVMMVDLDLMDNVEKQVQQDLQENRAQLGQVDQQDQQASKDSQDLEVNAENLAHLDRQDHQAQEATLDLLVNQELLVLLEEQVRSMIMIKYFDCKHHTTVQRIKTKTHLCYQILCFMKIIWNV